MRSERLMTPTCFLPLKQKRVPAHSLAISKFYARVIISFQEWDYFKMRKKRSKEEAKRLQINKGLDITRGEQDKAPFL